jgi:DUF1680 family protein
MKTEMPGGHAVRLTQETEYPWSGRVRLTINECGGATFALKLRIPGWAKNATVRLNGELLKVSQRPADYFELRRVWRPGDLVDLDFSMPARLIEAHPLVEETLNQVAVQRGPIVYCLESPDLPQGTRVLDVLIPENIDLVARYDGRLLGGIVVLEGKALARHSEDWTGQLYRELHPASAHPVNVRLIPYCVWANRGPSEMTVWLPLYH